MNSRNSHKIISIVFFFVVHGLVSAQTPIIKAGIDKNAILIGEQIHLNLEAYFPLHEPMRFFSVDTIMHFEILDRRKIDTLDNREGIRLIQVLTLTSFDSGHWVIPAFELPGDKPMLTDSLVVDVGFTPFDSTADYHDIKEVIDVPVVVEKKSDWYWYAGASAIIVALMLYFLLRRKKKQPVGAVPAKDAFVDAKDELEKLKKENPPPKIFYTRLINVFRLYVSRRKDINSLQETTDDLVGQLREIKLPAEAFGQLSQHLRMGDFVKFAKYEASETDKTEAFSVIKNIIEYIEKKELQNLAKTQS